MKKIKIYSNKRNVKHLERIFFGLGSWQETEEARTEEKRGAKLNKKASAETKQKEAETGVWVEQKGRTEKRFWAGAKTFWAGKNVFGLKKKRATR